MKTTFLRQWRAGGRAALITAVILAATTVPAAPPEAAPKKPLLAPEAFAGARNLAESVEPGAVTNRLIAFDAAWKYHDLGTNLGTAWRARIYNDGFWPEGPALLGYETAPLPLPEPLPLPLLTPLARRTNSVTHYFRKRFIFDGDPATTELWLRTAIDDGAVFYLNGVEVFRLGMPATNATLFTTLANRAVVKAAIEGPFFLRATNLLVGTNVLAAELHQSSLSSSDAIFGAELESVVSAGLPPQIVTGPQNQTVNAGGTATFTVGVSGTPPFTYQWFFNSDPIPDATGPSLTLSNVQTNQAGGYAVEVAGDFGFAFSAEGLLTVIPPPVNETTRLFGFDQVWRYDNFGGDLGTAWRTPAFDDSFWPSGPGLLGAETSPFVYPVPILTPFSNVIGRATYYFRTHFNFNGDPQDTLFFASNYLDDGAVFYFNGVEAARVRMPAGVVGFTTLATAISIEGLIDAFAVPSGLILPGDNVIAVEVHQSALASSDLIMGMSLYALSTNTNTPRPVVITGQPQDVTVQAGESAAFTVSATGTPPLQYQWLFNGAPLPLSNSPLLTRANVQPAQAGAYSVIVANSFSSTTSSVATLTVLTTSNACAPRPAGLVAWWPLNGNTNDVIGTNVATLRNGASFTTGMAGTGIAFDGSNDMVQIADNPSLDLGNALTVELWFKWQSILPNGGALFDKRVSGTGNAINYGALVRSNGVQLYFRSEVSPIFQTSLAPLPSANVFHHLAATYRQAGTGIVVNTYLDGQLAASSLFSGSLADGMNNGPLTFGTIASGAVIFRGAIDEPSVYNRELPASEVLAVFNAGAAGKCATNTPPPQTPVVITRQPESQTVLAGSAANFSVQATGTPPLTHRWLFNGSPLPGATNSTLGLSNAQPPQAGPYSVIVANSISTVTSAVATLTVLIPGTNCAPRPAGLAAWWPLNGNPADEQHGADLILFGNAAFGTGKVSQALRFDGALDFGIAVGSPSLDVGAGDGMSVETWIKPDDATTFRPLVEWSDFSTFGVTVALSVDNVTPGDGAGSFDVNLRDLFGNAHQIRTPAGVVQAGVWQHVALTYDKASGVARLFVNGSVAAQATLGTFQPQTSFPFYVGERLNGPFSGIRYVGAMDELSLYQRALAPAEVQLIYLAGSLGKCSGTIAPPFITEPPRSVTAVAGEIVSFSVTASGAEPLRYQWLFNNAPLGGASNRVLELGAVDAADAGPYAVIVSNGGGSVTSDTATLTVTTAGPCTSVPFGIVGWWPFNSDFNDLVGANPALPTGSPVFGPGRVGNALLFDGADDFAVAAASPALNVGLGQGLTVEGWINPADVSQLRPIVEWNDDEGGIGAHLWLSVDSTGDLYANLVDTSGNTHLIHTPAGRISAGVWQHVALTYERSNGLARLYHNGLLAAQTNLGAFTPQTSYPFFFGLRPTGAFSGIHFAGGLDEISVYNRGLTSQQIATLHAAGAAGKCAGALRPCIVRHPQSQTVATGGTILLSVFATGTEPLNYLWRRNGSVISNATGSTFTIENATTNNAGTYSVLINNFVGSVTSSNAFVTVTTPGVPPVITSITPTNQTVPAGSNAAFTVSATGAAPLAYQWQFAGTNLPGRTNAVLSLTAVQPADGGAYRCVVSNPFGSATSGDASLSVSVPNSDPPFITSPTGVVLLNAQPGSNVTLSVTATGAAPLGYHWFFNGPTQPVPGWNGPTQLLARVQAADSGTYTVIVSNQFGLATNRGMIVNVINTNQPSSGINFVFPPGGSNVFVFAAPGSSNHVPIGSAFLAQLYAGPTDDSLQPLGGAAGFALPGRIVAGVRRITGLSTGQTVRVQVRAWDAAFGASYEQALAAGGRVGNSITFPLVPVLNPGVGTPLFGLQSFTLGPGLRPEILTQPQSLAVMRGSNAAFSVTATGSVPLSYQWRRNGFDIPGATGPVLSLTDVQPAQAGLYSVVVSNPLDAANSDDAELTVISTNSPPVAFAQTVTLSEDSPAALALGASDPDGDALTFNVGTPAHGVLSGTPPNLIYSPAANYHGPDSFTFTVSDGALTSPAATVSLTIQPVNDAPVPVALVSPLNVLIPGNTNWILISSNGSNAFVVLDASLSSDVDGDPLTFAWYFAGTDDEVGFGVLLTNAFPVGPYAIVLAAYDGRAVSESRFEFTVLSPGEAVEELLLFLSGSDLGRKQLRPLQATLKAAIKEFDRGHFKQGAHQLDAFIKKVDRQISRDHPELAAQVTAIAREILRVLGR